MPLRPRHSARAHRSFWRHWTLWIYFPLAVLLLAGGVFLWRSGHWLIHEDEFEKASWAVILAGESREVERSDAALKLYLEGRIDTAIYSATRIFKTRYASEWMVEYLEKNGYPREKLFEFRQDDHSTLEEARNLIRQFRWQNLDTVLIITSNYHTARTRRIFHKLSQGYPYFLVYPAEFALFDPSSWWSSREGRKYWLLEWTKTVATWFELLGATPETGKSEGNGLTGYLGLPPSATTSAALLDSIAAAATRDSAGRADSLSVRGDSADTAGAFLPDSARAAVIDTVEQAGTESAAAKGAAKDSVTPKASAKPTTKATAKPPAKKAPEKEKEKPKKKPSR